MSTAALWRLEAAALPSASAAYAVADLCRRAAMGAARRLLGPERIPFALHGHANPAEGPRPLHRHAFFLPFDGEGAGRIDRVLIHAPGGLDREAALALAACERVYDANGADWPVRCVFLGPVERTPAAPAARAAVWASATPWLHTLHTRGARRGPDALLLRDLAHRGFPPPLAVAECGGPAAAGRPLARADLLTALPHRTGDHRPRPAGIGSFWRIVFADPVQGPIALGWECHLGLGLFVPADGGSGGSR